MGHAPACDQLAQRAPAHQDFRAPIVNVTDPPDPPINPTIPGFRARAPPLTRLSTSTSTMGHAPTCDQLAQRAPAHQDYRAPIVDVTDPPYPPINSGLRARARFEMCDVGCDQLAQRAPAYQDYRAPIVNVTDQPDPPIGPTIPGFRARARLEMCDVGCDQLAQRAPAHQDYRAPIANVTDPPDPPINPGLRVRARFEMCDVGCDQPPL
jgi:hypothetical protein